MTIRLVLSASAIALAAALACRSFFHSAARQTDRGRESRADDTLPIVTQRATRKAPTPPPARPVT
jgi:hypothetical protein